MGETMTNNPTIDGVSRERQSFEKFYLDRAERFHPDLSRRGGHPESEYQNPAIQGDWEIWQGRALLDAPDICPTCDSRSGCPDCKPEPVLLGYRIETEHGHHFKDSPTRGIGINCIELTDRSEVAALQSTIAQLQARIAELESGRGEVVGYRYRLSDKPDREWSFGKYSMRDRGLDLRYECQPLYTAPPATVAVVLPERKPVLELYDDLQEWHQGWNACLDATAALNEVKP